jgi:hypothetical protein
MSSYPPFSSIDVSTLVVKKPRANATAGKSAYVDRSSKEMPTLFTSSKDMRLLWPIRPGSAERKGDSERLNLELGVPRDDAAFESKAREVDAHFLKSLMDSKTDAFGASKAKTITSLEAMKPLYKPLLREGSENAEGGKYPDTVRLKVDGWAGYIKELATRDYEKDGKSLKLVTDCVWSERMVDDAGRNAPTDRDTHFYLMLETNALTGRAKYTDRLPLLDAAGKFVLGKDAKPLMRFVGPQDCPTGSQLTVIFGIPKLYITESCGPTAVAREVYIKPAPKKVAKKGLEDADIVTDVDPEALRTAFASDDGSVPSLSVAEEEGAPPPTAIAEQPQDTTPKEPEAAPKKRKSVDAATPGGGKKAKPSKMVALEGGFLEEDF